MWLGPDWLARFRNGVLGRIGFGGDARGARTFLLNLVLVRIHCGSVIHVMARYERQLNAGVCHFNPVRKFSYGCFRDGGIGVSFGRRLTLQLLFCFQPDRKILVGRVASILPDLVGACSNFVMGSCCRGFHGEWLTQASRQERA